MQYYERETGRGGAIFFTCIESDNPLDKFVTTDPVKEECLREQIDLSKCDEISAAVDHCDLRINSNFFQGNSA